MIDSACFEIDRIDEFNKNMKHLVKKKKFNSLPKQIQKLVENFQKGEFSGDILTKSEEPTPYSLYKLRMPNEDTNEGKSNGYRFIYLAASKVKIVVFLTIYYKKETPALTDQYIQALVDGYFLSYMTED